MKHTPSFSDRIKQGWSKEQLMNHYAIDEKQYQKLLTCLEGLKAIEVQKKQVEAQKKAGNEAVSV